MSFRILLAEDNICDSCTALCAGIPALDTRMQRHQARRPVCHIGDDVLCVHLAVVNALDLQSEHVRHLIRRHELRPEREERREVLDDRQVARIALDVFVALQN